MKYPFLRTAKNDSASGLTALPSSEDENMLPSYRIGNLPCPAAAARAHASRALVTSA